MRNAIQQLGQIMKSETGRQPYLLTSLADLADVRGQHSRHEGDPAGEVPLEVDHEVPQPSQRLHHLRLPGLELLLGLLLQLPQEQRDRLAVAVAETNHMSEGNFGFS